jgi:hypothetical protein
VLVDLFLVDSDVQIGLLQPFLLFLNVQLDPIDLGRALNLLILELPHFPENISDQFFILILVLHLRKLLLQIMDLELLPPIMIDLQPSLNFL